MIKMRILAGLLPLAALVSFPASLPRQGYAYSASMLCFFEDGRADLNDQCRAAIDTIVSTWDRTRTVGHPYWPGPPYRMLIEVEGHAYDAGDDAYNQRLSITRAEVISEVLRARGIDADKLKAVGYGRTRPLIPDDPNQADQMKFNRYVQIIPR